MIGQYKVFERIISVRAPRTLVALDASGRNPAFDVEFDTDGEVPFAQLVIWCEGQSRIVSAVVLSEKNATYVARVPEGLCHARRLTLQAEGCRKADIQRAQADDWIKAFADVEILPAPVRVDGSAGVGSSARAATSTGGRLSSVSHEPKIYFGIHKHMHQPLYRAADATFWSGELDGIFGTRQGAYSEFIPDAIERYVHGNLAHAGLSTSWSGSLIEQLHRCHREGLCGGRFENWNHRLRQAATSRTAAGNPRLDFTAFGYFHPLMPLLPHRDIVRSIELHRGIVRDTFGAEASPILFPPETAFHVRMIPALNAAGITTVIYDSIHRYRACRDYPYGGPEEGMLPPNPAEQTNPSVSDWLKLQNVWAASPISPSLLRPAWIRYEDPAGKEHRVIGVPAERYLGNEDARGGFGALQYPSVMGQLHDAMMRDGTYDPKHPPFFLLHSDGDNYGGGADSYYRHNTEKLVDWLNADPRFELTTIRDYLDRFTPDPSEVIHVEPGSWSGADNGDPQFAKWFSRVDADYSPDINSWAVLTMLQNVVHAAEDLWPDSVEVGNAMRLVLTAETSCYWYWTGQTVWDAQVTLAANAAYRELEAKLAELVGRDTNGPTIFPPWVLPSNPGGSCWANQGLRTAARQGVLHTLVADICGIRSVEAVLRVGDAEQVVPLRDCGPYPSQTGARRTAHLFKCELPAGVGTIRYYLRATDVRGNTSLGSLERIHLA